MSTPDPTAIVTAPIGWAKAKPVIFTLFVLIVLLVAIRFREAIASAISKVPVVGKWLTGIAHAGIFLVGAGLALCHGAAFQHGHLGQAYVGDVGYPAAVLVMPGARSGKGGAS